MSEDPVDFKRNPRHLETKKDGSHIGGRLGPADDPLEFPKLNKRGMSLFD